MVAFGADQAPADQVRTMALVPSVQATAARDPAAATAGISVAVATMAPVALHVRPASVDTRARTAPVALASHDTITVLPLAAMRGMPYRPTVDDPALVVPSV